MIQYKGGGYSCSLLADCLGCGTPQYSVSSTIGDVMPSYTMSPFEYFASHLDEEKSNKGEVTLNIAYNEGESFDDLLSDLDTYMQDELPLTARWYTKPEKGVRECRSYMKI